MNVQRAAQREAGPPVVRHAPAADPVVVQRQGSRAAAVLPTLEPAIHAPQLEAKDRKLARHVQRDGDRARLLAAQAALQDLTGNVQEASEKARDEELLKIK